MHLRRLTARLQLGNINMHRSSDGSVSDENNGNGDQHQRQDVNGGDSDSDDNTSIEISDNHSISDDSDGSDSDGPDSDQDSDSSGDDLQLPAGYMAFLSQHQNKLDGRVNKICDELRGAGSSLHQIQLVREFVRDDGVIKIACAMEEGCSSLCPNHNKSGRKSLEEEDNATLPRPLTCGCPGRYLRQIILSRCHIEDDGACALAHAISNICSPYLKALDLSSNNITGIGATCLANLCVLGSCDALGLGCGIQTMVLSSNPILSVGALAFANALMGRRSECGECHQRDDNDNAAGFCSLKNLHVSGCRLGDEDAMVLGRSLLPNSSDSRYYIRSKEVMLPNQQSDDVHSMLPSLPKTNALKLLNLHSNCITLEGMEYLYSTVCASSPDRAESDTAADDFHSHCLQSLYCQSNHTVELGVIVDYETRDYCHGVFFDQEEDAKLLVDIKNYEMMGTEPEVDIEQLKALMIQKLLLKQKMMHALSINRQCSAALDNASSSDESCCVHEHSLSDERRQRILCAAASKKITQLIEEKLRPSSLTLPRRQDEYGIYIEEDDFLGLHSISDGRPVVTTVGKEFTCFETNKFPLIFSWINAHFHYPTALAVVFDILCQNPDVCNYCSVPVDNKHHMCK